MKRQNDTPLLEQYKKIKSQYPEEILLFHLGDFYETFFEDAEIVSKVLGIVLTSRPMGKNIRVPMAGIPVKSADIYINKLLEAGYKVAICDQTEEKESKTLLKRVVTEVITPGTIISETLLPEDTNQYLASYNEAMGEAATCLIDVSTGDIYYILGKKEEVLEEMRRLNIREIVLPKGVDVDINVAKTYRDIETFSTKNGYRLMREIFNITGNYPPLVLSVLGGALGYLREKKGDSIGHLQPPVEYPLNEYIPLDKRTVETLGLLGERSLYTLLNHCLTPMGKRLLKFTVLHPFARIEQIQTRLRRVEFFLNNTNIAQIVEENLKGVYDFERDLSRISSGKIVPKNLLRFSKSLRNALKILKVLKVNFNPELENICERIENTLVEDPPANISDGGYIRDGVDKNLDELRNIQRNAEGMLKKLEEEERRRTGITNLRIGYNSVFGYYIEVSRGQAKNVPEYYHRKQTLTNVERFTTDELQSLEDKIIASKEKAIRLEREIYKNLLSEILKFSKDIKMVSSKIAEIDLTLSFAKVSKKFRYTKPEVYKGYALEIKNGRHPTVEGFMDTVFVPNDTYLDENKFFALITGPNMGGKSTYLRQVGIICLMAHMGCFVPADYAKIPLLDRVFTRIGASDDLTRGISTFMAEMQEVANILNTATKNSLILLDEIGRGTSTHDGLAIAWAVSEYILNNIKAKTLFATHYIELSKLASDHDNAFNLTVKVEEEENTIRFLYKVMPGSADKSYGIYVAKLAGIPEDVVARAKELQEKFEREFLIKTSSEGGELVEYLKGLNVDALSPKDALDILYEIKRILDPNKG
ncbi:MAG: DNA mismatch repair protein MutS [candidate division WOR-3 bacterium]